MSNQANQVSETDEQRRQLHALYIEWRTPPASLVASIDRGRGVKLDYLGHADTTRALIEADPTWTLEPAAVDPLTGGPMITNDGAGNLQVWMRLTILGVSRLCVGTCPDSKREPAKELYGDALRNGAMRFGVALGLWSKSEWADDAKPTPAKRKPVASKATPADEPPRTDEPPPLELEQEPPYEGPMPGTRKAGPKITGNGTTPAGGVLVNARQLISERVAQLDGRGRGRFKAYLATAEMPPRSDELTLDQVTAANNWLDAEAVAGE
jgi:hypothetical protein